EPQKSDYAQSRRAILLAIKLRRYQNPDAVILVNDLDNQPERRDGMMQAGNEAKIKDNLIVVIGTPRWKREAWLLNAFVCQDEDEKRSLDEIRLRLGFHPCEDAERLHYSSATSDPERDPKKIARDLKID